MPETPDLKSRLLTCAEAWAAAHGNGEGPAPLSRLGKAVAGDANFFDRIAGGGGLNLATLEKFARYLADAASWPAGAVPEEAAAFAHAVGVPVHCTPTPPVLEANGATHAAANSAGDGAEATGLSGELSGRSEAA